MTFFIKMMLNRKGKWQLYFKKSCKKSEEIYKDNKWRMLAIRITNNTEELTICNIHASYNEEHRRKLFSENL